MAKTYEGFQKLMEGVQAGSSEAAQEFIDQYGPPLLWAVRKRLPERLRTKFDSQDFVQDVWASFFALPKAGFTCPDQVVAFLARVARNKVVDAMRQRMQGKKFNLNREQNLEPHFAADTLASNQPTPSEIAISKETWENMLRRQPLVYRRILILFRQGKTADDIARELGISIRNIRRVIDKVMPRMKR